jgi:hypothetical protein
MLSNRASGRRPAGERRRSGQGWRARLEEAMRRGYRDNLGVCRKPYSFGDGWHWRRRCRGRPDGVGQDYDGTDGAVIGCKADRLRRRRRRVRPGCRCCTGGYGGQARGGGYPRKFRAMYVPERQSKLDRQCKQRAPRSRPDIRTNPTHVGGSLRNSRAKSIPLGRRKCIKLSFCNRHRAKRQIQKSPMIDPNPQSVQHAPPRRARKGQSQ